MPEHVGKVDAKGFRLPLLRTLSPGHEPRYMVFRTQGYSKTETGAKSMPMLVRMPKSKPGKSIRLNEATLTSFQLDGG